MAAQAMKVVALLARSHGLAALRALAGSHDVVRVFTPGYEPGTNKVRPDVPQFIRFASALCPVYVANGLNPESEIREACHGADVLVSVNWRQKVPADVLALTRYGGVNLHRGKLPEYAGARPVERAIAADETLVWLTAHRMTDVIDGGPVLVEKAVVCQSGPNAVQDTIDFMEPFVWPVLMEALAIVEKEGNADR
jgi:methionyl-tRNA formyltransferase